MGIFVALLIGIVIWGCLYELGGSSKGAPLLPEGTGTAVFCVAILAGAYFLGGHHP